MTDHIAATAQKPAPPAPVHDAGPLPQSDETKAFLDAHRDNPVACYRHVREAALEATTVAERRALEALMADCAARVKEIGLFLYKERLAKAHALEAEGNYKDAIAALEDLPTEKDPIGAWKEDLAQARSKVEEDGTAAWESASATAEALAKDGKLNEAIASARRGLGFGLPAVTERATALLDRLQAQADALQKKKDAEENAEAQAKRDREQAEARERAFARVKKEYDQRRFGAAYAKAKTLSEDKASTDADRADATVILEDVRKRAEASLQDAGELLKSDKRDDARKAYQTIEHEFEGTAWAGEAKKGIAECNGAVVAAGGDAKRDKAGLDRLIAPQLLALGVTRTGATRTYCFKQSFSSGTGQPAQGASSSPVGYMVTEGMVSRKFCRSQWTDEETGKVMWRYGAARTVIAQNEQGTWMPVMIPDCKVRVWGQHPWAILNVLSGNVGAAVFQGDAQVVAGASCREIVLKPDPELTKVWFQTLYNTSAIASYLNLHKSRVELALYVGLEDGLIRRIQSQEHHHSHDYDYYRDYTVQWDFTRFNEEMGFDMPGDVTERLKPQ